MPNQKFPIERNGPKRIEISWSGMWKDFTAKFDGKDVGTWTKEELQQGKEVSLPDGSTFKAHLRRVGMGQELALLRNGQPLPGSAADPVTLVKTAAGILYFLAGLQALLGVVALVGKVELLLQLGMGIPSIVVGLILAVLGFFTMQRSRVALGVAMLLYAADGIYTVASSMDTGRPPIGTIVIHVLFLTAMWRGFKAMGELKEPAASSAP